MLTRAQEEILEMQVSWSVRISIQICWPLLFELILVQVSLFCQLVIAYLFQALFIALDSKLGWHKLAE